MNAAIKAAQSTPPTPSSNVIQVAVPVPLARLFDYDCATVPATGARIQVPFGSRQLVGFCMGPVEPTASAYKRKSVARIIDDERILTEPVWQLLNWAADYYQHPLGEVLAHGLPVFLRQGEAANYQTTQAYRATTAGQQLELNDLRRAKQQQRLLAALRANALLRRDIVAQEFSLSALKALIDKQLIEVFQHQPSTQRDWTFAIGSEPLQLNPEQALAVAAIGAAQRPQTYLLEGVTGSGKTEVYLQAMAEVLRKGKQVLVIVPEIGLTPQTLQRFQKRFAVPIVMLHSALTDRERLDAWLDAKNGAAAIVIGTRSAIFTPFSRLGMIVIDEEHDSSLKQQEGFRYHARDLAVVRGHKEQVPVILGSATPSLESINNVTQQRYAHLQLTQRAGQARPTRHSVVDIKQMPLKAGLSVPLIERMREELARGQQVLVFINRRGFAPALLCHECGWLAQCRRCDAYYTVHQRQQLLQCHHCGDQQRLPAQCHDCGSTQLVGRGVGTEQLEQSLTELFPDYPVLRIDRDSTRKKGSLQQHLADATENKYPLLVGTQMIAKGHHFPHVTLVAMLDIDGALYSADFRAAERLGQLITQVAGRAGRASAPGTVVLQTHHPDHDLLQDLIQNGYAAFARSLLKERELTQLPPFGQLALFRAEAHEAQHAQAALQAIAQHLPTHPEVTVLGPMPAVMERRAGRYRYQLLLQCQQRGLRQQLLQHCLPQLTQLAELRRVRWSLDVDPQDFS
ncbi:Primosomal protein N' [Pseudidiomarina piscicola]|uniref:Replication restart protein PriA n=1 Tax=Pseudidiomarina piscicola TaxID=2614830 RepID=A0A6S6WNE9_9GAMM|nr:primosomal protein N' [Pseudidiomarina piscicola]CAB0151432.1 Primosomal protein N' [Pseudidiomarina piscicola]VZT40911.1 Primosomal protein N' [Pseudomonas aeruginosa]